MGKKVLELTIDMGKTVGHFSSPNEMFGTFISGVRLDTSTTITTDGPTKQMMHHDTTTNNNIEKEPMTTMQHNSFLNCNSKIKIIYNIYYK